MGISVKYFNGNNTTIKPLVVEDPVILGSQNKHAQSVELHR